MLKFLIYNTANIQISDSIDKRNAIPKDGVSPTQRTNLPQASVGFAVIDRSLYGLCQKFLNFT